MCRLILEFASQTVQKLFQKFRECGLSSVQGTRSPSIHAGSEQRMWCHCARQRGLSAAVLPLMLENATDGASYCGPELKLPHPKSMGPPPDSTGTVVVALAGAVAAPGVVGRSSAFGAPGGGGGEGGSAGVPGGGDGGEGSTPSAGQTASQRDCSTVLFVLVTLVIDPVCGTQWHGGQISYRPFRHQQQWLDRHEQPAC